MPDNNDFSCKVQPIACESLVLWLSGHEFLVGVWLSRRTNQLSVFDNECGYQRAGSRWCKHASHDHYEVSSVWKAGGEVVQTG
jgi:hypothetical protein